MGNWLLRLAVLALMGFPLAVAGTRLKLWDYGVGLRLVGVSFLLAIAVIISGVFIYFWLRYERPQNARNCLRAAFISLIPVFFIGSQIIVAQRLPSIHNISTDMVDPPEFVAVALIRDADSNPLHYDFEELAAQQKAAYPAVKTLMSSLSPEAAHRRALVIADALGWEIVDEDALSGRVEATVTSRLWRFKDDVVIRIRSQGDQTAIDLRSVSRVGRSDLGANAARIKRFLTEFSKK